MAPHAIRHRSRAASQSGASLCRDVAERCIHSARHEGADRLHARGFTTEPGESRFGLRCDRSPALALPIWSSAAASWLPGSPRASVTLATRCSTTSCSTRCCWPSATMKQPGWSFKPFRTRAAAGAAGRSGMGERQCGSACPLGQRPRPTSTRAPRRSLGLRRGLFEFDAVAGSRAHTPAFVNDARASPLRSGASANLYSRALTHPRRAADVRTHLHGSRKAKQDFSALAGQGWDDMRLMLRLTVGCRHGASV